MKDIGLQPTKFRPQSRIGKRVEFRAFTNDDQWNTGIRQFFGKRTSPRQRDRRDVKFISWQPGGKQRELFLGAGSVERRNQENNTGLGHNKFEPSGFVVESANLDRVLIHRRSFVMVYESESLNHRARLCLWPKSSDFGGS